MSLSLDGLITHLLHGDDDWRKRLVKEWPSIVGDLHKRMRLEKVAHDVVVIGVYEVHWMHELYMMSSMITDVINKKLGGTFVTKIRFTVVNQTETKTKKSSALNQASVSSRPLAEPQKKALDNIQDQQLQEALSKLWQRCKT